ncbi:MAG: SapC family protein [Gammaproteobacteria bacterium]
MAEPQPQLPLFYRKVVPLSRERHGAWYVDPDPGFRFAARTNCVYVAGIEFPVAAREYAIVFAAAGGDAVVPVVLLGLKPEQNLFLAADGTWKGSYVPAYVRRYPFILAADSTGANFTVCIDESYAGFNTVKEGERLINDDGSHGALLARSVEFLKDYQRQTQVTTEFCRLLVELALLEPVQANVEMKTGEKFSLAGFSCVSRDRLKSLPGERLQDLVGRGFMDLVYAHLLSLSNLSGLMQKLG